MAPDVTQPLEVVLNWPDAAWWDSPLVGVLGVVIGVALAYVAEILRHSQRSRTQKAELVTGLHAEVAAIRNELRQSVLRWTKRLSEGRKEIAVISMPLPSKIYEAQVVRIGELHADVSRRLVVIYSAIATVESALSHLGKFEDPEDQRTLSLSIGKKITSIFEDTVIAEAQLRELAKGKPWKKWTDEAFDAKDRGDLELGEKLKEQIDACNVTPRSEGDGAGEPA